MKTRRLLSLLFVMTIGLSSLHTAAQSVDYVSRLKSQLFFYRTQNAVQSVVIQTDKTLYRQGEFIWLKSFVVDALTKNLSLKSLSVNVVILDNEGNTVTEAIFPLDGGRSSGTIQLPADLANGQYTLAAYTSEMTNGSACDAFYKTLYICRPENLDAIGEIIFNKEMASANKESASIQLKGLYKEQVSGKKFDYTVTAGEKELLSGKGKTGPDGKGEISILTPGTNVDDPAVLSVTLQNGANSITLQKKIPLPTEKVEVAFYPEGGNRVAGIPQLVVFKTKDHFGQPVAIEGDVITESGAFITKAMTLRDGLGIFHLQNNEPGNLKLKITGTIGKGQEVALPRINNDAMAISVKKNDGTNLSVMLASSPNSTNKQFSMIAVCGGELVWASEFELAKAGIINIPLADFTQPIAALVAFNNQGKLVGERLFSTGKGAVSNVTIETDKTEYPVDGSSRANITIRDAQGNPQLAELSTSIADIATQPANDPIFKNLTLGLKETIPSSITLASSDRLIMDYSLISNQLKGVNWEKIMAIDPEKPAPIYQNAKRVSGSVTDSQGNPVPNALINLSSVSMQQFKGRSNQHGEFEIVVPILLEKKSLTVSASDSTGKGTYKVTLNSSFNEEVVSYLKNHPKLNDWSVLADMKEYFDSNPSFENANPTPKSSVAPRLNESAVKSYLRDATSMLDVVKAIRPYELMGGKIVFRGSNSFYNQDGALIVIDGQKHGTDASFLESISPKEVEDVRVLVDPIEMSRYTALNTVGVIEITLRKGKMETPEQAAAQISNVRMNQTFAQTPIGNVKNNLVTTLLWTPAVSTSNGNEAILNFNTAKIKSNYVIKVAGFTDKGEWVEAEKIISVK